MERFSRGDIGGHGTGRYTTSVERFGRGDVSSHGTGRYTMSAERFGSGNVGSHGRARQRAQHERRAEAGAQHAYPAGTPGRTAIRGVPVFHHPAHSRGVPILYATRAR
ncbi:hypothetical protein BGC_39960 [Burkholderia sp. 3C]